MSESEVTVWFTRQPVMGAAKQWEQSTVWAPGQQNNPINRGCTPQRAQWSLWQHGAVAFRNKQDLNLCLSRPRLETCCTFLLESVCENQPSEFPPFRIRAEKPHTWPSKCSSWATVLAVAGTSLKAEVCGANLPRQAEGRGGLVWTNNSSRRSGWIFAHACW